MQIYEYGSPDAPVVLIEPIHVPEGTEEEIREGGTNILQKQKTKAREQP